VSFIGMDPEAVVQIAQKLATQERRVTTVAQSVDALMSSARGTWRGADLERFMAAWNGTHRQQILAAAGALAELSIKAYANAQEQTEVSNQYAGASMPAGGAVNIGGILSQLHLETSTSGSWGVSGDASGHTTLLGIPMSGSANYFAGLKGDADAHLNVDSKGLDAGASASGIAGGFASANGSIGNKYLSASGSAQGLVGAMGKADASMNISPDGMTMAMGASGVAGAQALANGKIGNSFANIYGSGEAMAGAEGSADFSQSITKDGFSTEGGVDGFAGAKLQGEAGYSFGGFSTSAGGALEAGAGGTAEAGFSFTKEDVGFSLNLGGALGGGIDLDVAASVNPTQVYNELGQAWNTSSSLASGAVHDVGSLLGKL